jgi:MFS family permease
MSNYFDYYVLSVLLEPIKKEFHASDTQLGMLSGLAFALMYAITALPIARWADRGNRRTVIAVSLTGWSLMTALCGLARSFGELAFTRLGVGGMEPGALPPAQSLIADYFPPERRALAISVVTMGGSAAGWLFGVGAGGLIAASYGWRTAFIVSGIPGLILALMVRFILSEPRQMARAPVDRPVDGSLRIAFVELFRKKSFIWLIAGSCAYLVFGYGVSVFLPSLLIRALHANVHQVSVTWGAAISAANITGALLGGWIADRLSVRDIRWYAWMPAIACLAGVPLYYTAISAHSVNQFIALDFLSEATLTVGYGVFFTAIQAVCGNPRRAMAGAIAQFAGILLGSGIGPPLAGAISDALSKTYGNDSLRYSLICMLGFLIPASVCFYIAARAMPHERED